MRLKGKVALITGAGRGIGRETALLFAREGVELVLCDLDEPALCETAAEAERAGAQALAIKADVALRNQVDAMVASALARFGRIDILINNAGVARDAQLLKMTEEQWDEVLAVNLKGTFNCGRAVAPAMIEQGRGKIINASSVVAIYGNFGQSNYAAAKAGIIALTKVWARELGPKGINVNAVAPGFIHTAMTEKVPLKVLEMMRERTPLKRLGLPIDVAKAYLFLASDDADYINGAVLCVDGGLIV